MTILPSGEGGPEVPGSANGGGPGGATNNNGGVGLGQGEDTIFGVTPSNAGPGDVIPGSNSPGSAGVFQPTAQTGEGVTGQPGNLFLYFQQGCMRS